MAIRYLDLRLTQRRASAGSVQRADLFDGQLIGCFQLQVGCVGVILFVAHLIDRQGVVAFGDMREVEFERSLVGWALYAVRHLQEGRVAEN